MINAVLAMPPHLEPFVFGDREMRRLLDLLELATPQPVTDLTQVPESQLSQLELMIAGWGMAPLGLGELDRMPRLRGIVHWGGGAGFLDPGLGQARGITQSTGRATNAIPVAEWTIAMIVLGAKDVFRISRSYCANPRPIDREREFPSAGLYGNVIGIVGASSVGGQVMERLKQHDVRVLVYDPLITRQAAAALGAELVPELAELAASSDILSIHAPWLPSTTGMVNAEVLAAMPDGATLINTARGAIVDQDALVLELEAGRINAIIDVTHPEVLPPDHPLYTLPNVFLTPHMAGSMGVELRRLGEAALREVENFAAGHPFEWPLA